MGYALTRDIKVSDLCEILGLEFLGDDILISHVAPFNKISDNSLSFYRELEFLERGVVIADVNCSDPRIYTGAIILSKRPRLDFIRALTYLFNDVGFSHYKFKSKIDPTVVMGENVVIEQGCVIGAGTIIEHNVVILEGTTIGENCRIRAGSVIGGDGFGFEFLEDNVPLRFPHIGGVEIGNNVEIGALNTIAKGALGLTSICNNVKTDNLVHIAHNCEIGENTLITASAELSGGVKVGPNVWIGPNASIIQKVELGEGAFIGIGAVVTKDVRAKTLVAGNPAKRVKDIID